MTFQSWTLISTCRSYDKPSLFSETPSNKSLPFSFGRCFWRLCWCFPSPSSSRLPPPPHPPLFLPYSSLGPFFSFPFPPLRCHTSVPSPSWIQCSPWVSTSHTGSGGVSTCTTTSPESEWGFPSVHVPGSTILLVPVASRGRHTASR